MGEVRIGKFILAKAVRLATLLVFLCILTFTLLELSPIDPVTAYVGADPAVGAEQREKIAEHWGLDKPPVERFFSWFSSMARGDWGTDRKQVPDLPCADADRLDPVRCAGILAGDRRRDA